MKTRWEGEAGDGGHVGRAAVFERPAQQGHAAGSRRDGGGEEAYVQDRRPSTLRNMEPAKRGLSEAAVHPPVPPQ